MYTLEDLGLIGGPPDAALSQLVKIASRACGVQASLVKIRDERRSKVYCQAHYRLGTWHNHVFEMPKDESLTHLVCEQNALVAISDAKSDARVAGGSVARILRFRGIMGAPILGPDQEPIGALTVCSLGPKDWTDAEKDSLRSVAFLTSQHVLLRATFATLKILREESGLKSA